MGWAGFFTETSWVVSMAKVSVLGSQSEVEELMRCLEGC